jgi:hypothetical protein
LIGRDAEGVVRAIAFAHDPAFEAVALHRATPEGRPGQDTFW